MVSSTLWFSLLPLLACGLATVCWFLIRRRQALASGAAPRQEESIRLDLLVVLLCFFSIFLLPVRFRSLFVEQVVKHYGNFNVLGFIAVALTLLRIRRWSAAELICFCCWCLLLIPMAVSNESLQRYKKIIAVSQSLLPLFLVLYPMNPASRRKVTGWFIVLFDIIIAVLLVCGIIERLTNQSIRKLIIDLLESNGLNAVSFTRTMKDKRFYSIWGHPLSNAVFFNSFFVLNVLWLRANKRKCPTFIFFMITLGGVLLASSKTGITVCFLLQVLMNWKHKKWLLISIPVLALLYFLGAFNGIITRFTTSSLTTGRVEALKKYLPSGIEPFRFFSGYGSNVIMNSSHPLTKLRAAFEFPLLMFAHDYGILFSVVHIFGLFAYTTWRLLRNRNWIPWLCWSLLFAEINTFNAYTLRSQDDCLFFCLLTLILLTMLEKNGTAETPPDNP